MTLLAADTSIDALPWVYVVALCGGLTGALVVMWRRDVTREAERIDREKGIADQARTDGAAVATALATAATAMKETSDMIRLLVSRVEAADTERRTLAGAINERLEELAKTIDGCRVRP